MTGSPIRHDDRFGRRILASAVTHDGKVVFNAVVTIVPGAPASVTPIDGETHSTMHVNGIVHFGSIPPGIETSCIAKVLTLAELAATLAPQSGALTATASLLELTPRGLRITPLL